MTIREPVEDIPTTEQPVTRRVTPTAATVQLLRECLAAYTDQRDAAQRRLEAEQQRPDPDKKKLARHQRAINWYTNQIAVTQAQLAEALAGEGSQS